MKRLFAILLSMLLLPLQALPQCIVPANGAVVKTTNYTALAADTGKLIVMNCASACTLTLPSTPQSPVWEIWTISIGAGQATVSPNGLNLNGGSASINIPQITGAGMYITTDNSNYFAKINGSIFYAAGGGTAQAQTMSVNPGPTSLYTGLFVEWLPTAANTTAAPTLAVNSLTAKTITKMGTVALVANDLTTTAVAYAIYDGTEFQLMNPQTNMLGDPGANGLVKRTGLNVTTAVSTTRVLGWSYGDVATGSALTTSEVGYITSPIACTITGWHIMADAGTVTIKTARVNGGTALPTIGSNSISTSGVSLASGTKIDSTTVTDFTSTAIAANDTLGFFITTVATAKQITFQLDCAQ